VSNWVGWPKPKRKKPVTLIVGLICKDAIVLAADSQTTKGTAKQLGANKISVVEFENGKAAVAESGSASLSNAAIQIFQSLAKGKKIENELTVAKTAELAVRQVLAGITQHLNPNSPDRDRQDFLFQDINYFELMVAYYFGNKPCLYILKSAWGIPVPASSFFLTSGIAGDLANYILQEHTTRDMDKNLAPVIVIKTVKDAIDYVEGCGLPIRVALVHKPYRQQPFKVVPKKGSEHLAISIGEEVFGEVESVPSSVQLYEATKVEGITKIISTIEQKGKNSRNKKLHKALQAQTNAYFRKMEREFMDFAKKHPGFAAKAWAEMEKTGQAYRIVPDSE
jgi:20S proteasome alpha/beta subunit